MKYITLSSDLSLNSHFELTKLMIRAIAWDGEIELTHSLCESATLRASIIYVDNKRACYICFQFIHSPHCLVLKQQTV